MSPACSPPILKLRRSRAVSVPCPMSPSTPVVPPHWPQRGLIVCSLSTLLALPQRKHSNRISLPASGPTTALLPLHFSRCPTLYENRKARLYENSHAPSTARDECHAEGISRGNARRAWGRQSG